MTKDELKKLAEAATPGPWDAGSRSVTANETEDCPGLDVSLYGGNGQQKARNARYIAAANPDAILKLLAINAELVEALKVANAHVVELCTVFNIPLPDASIEKISAALAKAEGGEL